MKPLHALSLASIVSLGVSCKRIESSSDVDTLDALAGTEKGLNECSGSNITPFDLPGELGEAAKRQITFPAHVESEVKRAFTSVPSGLSRALVMLGYEVRYVDDAAQQCQGVRGVLNQAMGCAKVSKIETSSGDGEKVELILSSKPADIAHSTLLGVMGLLGNKLGKISVQDDAFVLTDDEDLAMTKFKHDFAVAVIHDAARRGKSLEQIKSLLPANAKLTARNTSLAERSRLWEMHMKSSQKNAQAAELSIFANGADSYYCSSTTFKALSSWPTAKRLWAEKMHPDLVGLEKLGSDAAVATASNETSEEGFGLWGRWGYGNGPIRQMFSNRIAQTGYAFPRLHGLRRGWDGSGNWYSPPAWGNGRLGWRINGTGSVYGLTE